MIVDARMFADSTVDCDVCIIGGGAAGISLAVELANTPARVYVLESGGLRHEASTQALLRGELVGSPYPGIHETRLAALGGSTAVWAGWCRPLDPIDFEVRDWIPDSGWPFTADELLPFYARAHALCGLGPVDYDPASWTARTGRKPLALENADFESRMFHISPLTFGDHYRPDLERMRNLTTVLHATALRVDTDRDGNRIERIRAITSSKRNFAVNARIVVLAAGGIENARLLLLSGDSPERSIGNANGLVGRYFMEHGFIDAGTYFVADAPQSLEFHFPMRTRVGNRDCTVRGGLAPSPQLLRSERLLNGAVFFHPAYEAHPVFDTREVKATLEIWDKLRGRAVPGGYAHRTTCALRAPMRVAHAIARRVLVRRGRERWRTRAVFECTPQRDNRVTLSPERDAFGRPRARVYWRPADIDLASAKHMHALLDRSLRRAGLGRFECRLANDEAWRAAVNSGKHHMGTTRMHGDPAHGVVDADCRVHGIDNLYVAGSSVFPTGGFAHPTLTIVALAVRLAAHLRGRLAQ
jgi:choline dehydrogenase-like flavoprotein